MKIWNKKKKYSDNFLGKRKANMYGDYVLLINGGHIDKVSFERFCKMKSEQLNLLKAMS